MNRIKRLQGQLNAVEKAVNEGESSCIEILQQVAAIKGAITGLNNEQHSPLHAGRRHCLRPVVHTDAAYPGNSRPPQPA